MVSWAGFGNKTVKMYLSKATWVVVAQRSRVSKRLQDGVGIQHALFQFTNCQFRRLRLGPLRCGVQGGNASQIGHNELRGFGLSRSGLTRDDDSLVLGLGGVVCTGGGVHQRSVGVLGQHEQVRRQVTLQQQMELYKKNNARQVSKTLQILKK